MTDAQLHAASIAMGVDICSCDPPHPPRLLIEVVAYATACGRHWEVTTTFREIA